ncbi:hypothetical protein QBC43DRAFT_202945 [Cladorrhinum sp. PSN259]|nr:hypothetical protein QBC43DRAFT_202945 [Cladorrhinum sp. PSN259]
MNDKATAAATGTGTSTDAGICQQPAAATPGEQTETPYSLETETTTTNNNLNREKTNARDNEGQNGVQTAKKPGVLARVVAKLGLDAPTLITMFKGSLPPTIAIAMYQARAVSSYFITVGYLIPIVSILGLTVLPRGKFLMNLLLNVLAVSFGSAVSMLALWSAIKAREHTTPPGTQPTPIPAYNSSQSAVCGVWLFFNIWFGNVVRAKLPAFNLPVIIYSILVNVAATNGPFMTSVTSAHSFVRQLMTAMLVALALCLGVNLFVFPISSRLVVFKEFEGAIGLLRKTVALQKAYLVSIEKEDMFATVTRTNTSAAMNGGKDKPRLTKEEKAAKALREVGGKLRELAGKLHADIPFAKRDFAWGKLDAKDISELFSMIRNVYIPVLGMMTIIDIFKRVSEHRGWNLDEDEVPDEVTADKEREKHIWNEVMKQMHEPFEILSEAIDQGLEHAGICLEILPRPKKARKGGVDVEARGEKIGPGDPALANVIKEKVEAFYSKKGELLNRWVKERGFNPVRDEADLDNSPCSYWPDGRERDQAQLYIVLYMENLMHASGKAVQDLVAFADRKVQDGTMSKKRLIAPGVHRLRKWFMAILRNEDSSAEQSPDLMETSNTIVSFGDGYNLKRDPEHLPPATAWERFGNGLRKISKFFGSEESMFGFRVACATMTVGIIAFLEDTQRFFQEQRLVWAMIIIAIGMTMTSGQSFFGFLCRVGGTLVAAVFSLIIWYIVNGRTAGAIVFLWLFTFVDYYFFIKYPRFIPAIMIIIVTQVLIIGYGLQTAAIGRAVAERTGQPVYPTYLLAPYRLACVAGGSLVAFFWTIFPSPLTDRTWLRRDLSATLYLVANYFGVISSTLRSNLDGTTGDAATPGTPSHHLHKIGRKIFGKVMMLIPSMSQHSEWQRWEPTIGGKFPREAYDDIILRSTRIMAYLTLISYTLMHPTHTFFPQDNVADGEDEEENTNNNNEHDENTTAPKPRTPSIAFSNESREWLDAMAKVLTTLNPTHHTILSTLTLLSNSLLSGQSLPPFLPLPKPYELTRRLMRLGNRARLHHHDEDDEEYGSPIHLVNSRTGRADYMYDNVYEDMDEHKAAAQAKAAADLLDPKNMEQPGYAEFAVLQVCITLVCDDLGGLVRAVSKLVGVVDFSFRFEDGKMSSSGSNSEFLGGLARGRKRKGKGKGKGKAD